MLATLDHRLCLELLLNPIKLVLFYNGCVKAFVHFTLMSDLPYVDGIDQNVVYAPTAPVSLWPKFIYGTRYFAETSKLLIKIIDMPDIRRSLLTYLERLYLWICFSPLKLCHYLMVTGGFKVGTETVFGRRCSKGFA